MVWVEWVGWERVGAGGRGEGKEGDRAAGSRKNCRKNHSCSPKS